MDNEILINGEGGTKDKQPSRKITLIHLQLILSLAAVLFLLIIKSFFPGFYTEVKAEYESRMYDPIFAEEVGAPTVSE